VGRKILFLGLILLAGLRCEPGRAEVRISWLAPAIASSVTLGWDASADTNVIGYLLYWGTASGDYTSSLNTTGLVAQVTGLHCGTTYNFAATAVGANGLESPFSNEVSYTTPGCQGVLPAAVLYYPPEAGSFPFWNLEMSVDLVSWSVVAADIGPFAELSLALPATNALALFRLAGSR
jgi:hypothetical protein